MMDNGKQLVNRAEEFLLLFKKGAEFTQELLKENERLRFRVLELEQGNNCSADKAAESSPDAGQLRIRIKELEEENHDFAMRSVEIEQDNNNLASLYIASHQLHSTLDFQDVLQIIVEILINLIGAEEFAIMLIDERAGELQAVAAEGMDLEEIPRITVGEGIVGKAAVSGEDYFAEQLISAGWDIAHPLVCVPLKIKDTVIGVLVIGKLLIQKTSFAPVDYELFTLLAAHAATAIFAARLYSASERKLTTIQGFLDLLTRKV